MGWKGTYLDSYHTASALYSLYGPCVSAPAPGEQWRGAPAGGGGDEFQIILREEGIDFGFLRNRCNL